MNRVKKYNVIPTSVVCRSCKKPAECREHTFLTEKQVRASFFYKKWYICKNQNCRTTMFTFEEDKVMRKEKIDKRILENMRAERQRVESHMENLSKEMRSLF